MSQFNTNNNSQSSWRNTLHSIERKLVNEEIKIKKSISDTYNNVANKLEHMLGYDNTPSRNTNIPSTNRIIIQPGSGSSGGGTVNPDKPYTPNNSQAADSTKNTDAQNAAQAALNQQLMDMLNSIENNFYVLNSMQMKLNQLLLDSTLNNFQTQLLRQVSELIQHINSSSVDNKSKIENYINNPTESNKYLFQIIIGNISPFIDNKTQNNLPINSNMVSQADGLPKNTSTDFSSFKIQTLNIFAMLNSELSSEEIASALSLFPWTESLLVSNLINAFLDWKKYNLKLTQYLDPSTMNEMDILSLNTMGDSTQEMEFFEKIKMLLQNQLDYIPPVSDDQKRKLKEIVKGTDKDEDKKEIIRGLPFDYAKIVPV